MALYPMILRRQVCSWITCPRGNLGVLVQSRDLARAFRKEFSRSQSQSTEDVNLKIAEPQFNFDNKSWALPSSESEYRRGNKELMEYLDRLSSRVPIIKLSFMPVLITLLIGYRMLVLG